MTVLCGVIPPRLVKTEEWATEDDWLVYELAQKQRKGIQERFFNCFRFLLTRVDFEVQVFVEFNY